MSISLGNELEEEEKKNREIEFEGRKDGIGHIKALHPLTCLKNPCGGGTIRCDSSIQEHHTTIVTEMV